MNAPLSPLEQAGLNLDLAARNFTEACAPGATVGEELFGELERQYLDAQAEYARLVAERLGVDAETLVRRLAA